MLLTAFDICKKYTGAVDEELMPYIKGTSGISQESEESPCNMIVLIELELQGEESVECFIKEWKDLAKNQEHLCLMKFRKTKPKNDKDVIKLQGKATFNFGS